jgi:glycosyltransferase involved in cell wall biosynthesis
VRGTIGHPNPSSLVPSSRQVPDLRVLALTPYPPLAAATRYRLTQLESPLLTRGIHLDVRPFLNNDEMQRLYAKGVGHKVVAVGKGLVRRATDLMSLRDVDVVLVQREAMLVGPPLVEWLTTRLGSRPLVLDIDDPVWLPEQTQVPSPLSAVRRWPGKTHWLLSHATLVTCGSRFLAEHVEGLGYRAHVVPNGIDTGYLCPGAKRAGAGTPTVGWIGSHTTYGYLESLFSILEKVATKVAFRLVVVGSGRSSTRMSLAVPTELRAFSLQRELEDFRSLDVGLYPLADDPWAKGKSGLKALQYLAAGVPYVASPVGVVAEIGIPGVTHLLARSPEEWVSALVSLLDDADRRSEMSLRARAYAEAHNTLDQSADALAAALRAAAAA